MANVVYTLYDDSIIFKIRSLCNRIGSVWLSICSLSQTWFLQYIYELADLPTKKHIWKRMVEKL